MSIIESFAPTAGSMANINWNKLQQVSEGTIITLANLITQIPAIGNSSDHAITALIRSNRIEFKPAAKANAAPFLI